jgi:hypothetical protein
MNDDLDARNRDSRDRLARTAARVRDGMDVAGGWTAAALLAHVAFWDRVALARWRRDPMVLRRIDEPILDLVNEAALPVWRALPAADAAREAVAAADAFNAAIAGAAAGARERAARASRSFVDRSTHRNEHLDQIERALG